MALEFWEAAVRRHWGVDARLVQLDGEYDLNFRVHLTDGADRILKVMRPGCPTDLVEMQVQALDHLVSRNAALPVPKVMQTPEGQSLITLTDPQGAARLAWMISALPGRCYARVNPKSTGLIHEVGDVLARTTVALADFQHEGLDRDFKWDLMQASWIKDHTGCITNPTRRQTVDDIIATFEALGTELETLPRQAIHNDANDYNILMSGNMETPLNVSGLIDLGDMCRAPRICDLAIAAAYVVLDHPAPVRALADLVAGYHAQLPLSVQELALLWPLLRMRLAVSVVNSTLMASETPDDPYVTISQGPAWRFLEQSHPNPALILARLRLACGMPVVDGADRVMEWLKTARGSFAPLIDADLAAAPMGTLAVDRSVEPRNPFDLTTEEAAVLGGDPAQGSGAWLGYYREPRLIYTDDAFRNGPYKASDRRTVHMAVDIFAPAGTAVHAPMPATVVLAEDRDGALDYGGMIILRHDTPQGDSFFTLYGHLDPTSFADVTAGDTIAKGSAFCAFGAQPVNGGWAPHLHFQILMTDAGMAPSWPGVADPDDLDLWEALCPSPAALMNLEDAKVRYDPPQKDTVLEGRKSKFGGNLSLTYSDPVMLMRGWQHHLFDQWGRPYLDAYNNVPHVGHAHPRIQAVAADQLKRMNSNTRYLHPAQTAFADKVLSKMPEGLEVCYFVNSGSEANELALRLARAHTGAMGMITPNHGYHGNTTGAIDISAYKFAKPGGVGQVDWVELVDVADDYRGQFGRDDPDRAQHFADLVSPAIGALEAKGVGVAGFIAETFPSVGGQIIPPKGYLPAVYDLIRAAGGVCIADEVQTGLGRLGHHYFGFEQQGAMPDMVVLGKPIGNGHPIGVVVTTRAIADSFDNGIEFFSTFGGSTLSCRIGKEVLDIVDDEALQDNARIMGDRLLEGLGRLQGRYQSVGDVRGIGLFVGLELINPDGSEATEICTYVKNRMREYRILIGSEGPKDNILKIRPPLTIQADDIDMILETLDKILGEVALWGH